MSELIGASLKSGAGLCYKRTEHCSQLIFPAIKPSHIDKTVAYGLDTRSYYDPCVQSTLEGEPQISTHLWFQENWCVKR